MRLFGRSGKDHDLASASAGDQAFAQPAPQPVELVPLGAYELPAELTLSRDDGTRIRFIETRADAKSVTTALKLHKKQLQLQKREITAEMQRVRADYRLDNSRRTRVRGSGSLARSVRTFQQISRDSARRKHGSAIDALDDQKAAVDAQISFLDRVLLEIERFVLSLPEDPKPAPNRKSAKSCPSCGVAAKASDKFCSECGEPLGGSSYA